MAYLRGLGMRRITSEEFERMISIKPLREYKGDLTYNIHCLATFLYDLPRYVENPMELYDMVVRYLENRASKKDKVVVQLLIHRLAEFDQTRKLAKQLSGVEEPENFWLVR